MSYNSWQLIKPEKAILVDKTYDTFWFNLCPIFQRQVALISMEMYLMNPDQSKDPAEKNITKKISDFSEIIYNRLFNGVKLSDEHDNHEKKDE
jgi:hypothetical protein